MNYEGAVYRPPSEARSLIIQVTIGCSHNKCTFCDMYKNKKFRIRKISEIVQDLMEAKNIYGNVERIFLADGNALILKMEDLRIIFKKIKEIFPECKNIGIYSAPKDILLKSVDDLKELKSLGLSIAYLGVESGSSRVLEKTKKGVSSEEMIKAGKKMVESGIKLSVMIISGLGGKEHWEEHAKESARVVNEINPDYLALLTLLINPNTELNKDIEDGKFNLLSPREVILETKKLISNLELTNCIFRSNHASNYLILAGTLPSDKNKLIKKLDSALKNDRDFKLEEYRRF